MYFIPEWETLSMKTMLKWLGQCSAPSGWTTHVSAFTVTYLIPHGKYFSKWNGPNVLENEIAHSFNSIRRNKKLFKWTTSVINTLKPEVAHWKKWDKAIDTWWNELPGFKALSEHFSYQLFWEMNYFYLRYIYFSSVPIWVSFPEDRLMLLAVKRCTKWEW